MGRLDMKLQLPIKPFSTNRMYTGKKRRSCWYKGFTATVHKMLKDQGYSPSYFKVREGRWYSLSLIIGVSTKAFDASNGIKSIEDCVASYFKFNDNIISKVSCRKYIVPRGSEFIMVELKGCKGNVRLKTGFDMNTLKY